MTNSKEADVKVYDNNFEYVNEYMAETQSLTQRAIYNK